MDQPEPALDEARLDAIASARQRAELYAQATALRIVEFSRSAKAEVITAPASRVRPRDRGRRSRRLRRRLPPRSSRESCR